VQRLPVNTAVVGTTKQKPKDIMARVVPNVKTVIQATAEDEFQDFPKQKPAML